MYDNVMNKFKWGGVDKPGVYIDENVMRMCKSYRMMLFNKLSEALVKEGKNDKALEVLDKCMQVLPPENVPLDYTALSTGELYYVLGQKEKAAEIFTGIADNMMRNINWYFRLNPVQLASVETELLQDMQVLNGSTVDMQDYGLFFPQLSQMFTFATNGSQLGILGPTSYGIGNEVLMGMGLPLAIIVCLYLWEQLVYKNERIEHSNKVFGLMLLSMWMTTYLFPWEILENIQGIGTLVAPYQFPWRFTGLTLGLGIILGSVALKNVQIVVGDTTKKVIIASISILAIIHFTSYSEMLIANAVPVKITSYAGIDTREAVVAGEYLLQNTYAMTIGAAEPQTEDGMTINNYKKEDGIVTLLYENLTGKDSYIKVPFFSYKGYHAVDSASGYELTIWHDWQNIAMILIPVDWSGELKVYFEEPIYWRVAEFISFTLVLWSLMHWVKIRWKKYLQR